MLLATTVLPTTALTVGAPGGVSETDGEANPLETLMVHVGAWLTLGVKV